MKILLYSFVLILMFLTACSTSQKKTHNNIENQPEVATKMTQDGFKLAHIVVDEAKDFPCNFLIKLENSDVLLEPLTPVPEEFQKNEMSIWIKYHPQRRMSRCGDTQPMELIAIRKKE